MRIQPRGTAALDFRREELDAEIIDPGGLPVRKRIEIRYDPITGRNCRIAHARAGTDGEEDLPPPPPEAGDRSECPFCTPSLETATPLLQPGISPIPRLKRGHSVLFPNLFPYGRYSAVSVIDDQHFVEIGTATAEAYRDCLMNCRDYLLKVRDFDRDAVYMAITQNHLPAAGGSLVHPHLQIHADRVPANYPRFLEWRARDYKLVSGGRLLFSDYLANEERERSRLIGRLGNWCWMAAFAPEGFHEIWALNCGKCSFFELSEQEWSDLAEGVIRIQRFYRGLGHNAYNFGLISVMKPDSCLELRLRMVVRSDYRQWSRNDHTGFETMLGDMATFVAPEETASRARLFWD